MTSSANSASAAGMLDLTALTRCVSDESRVRPLCAYPAASDALHSWVTPATPRIALPDMLTESRPLIDILQERRAVRAYDTRPIDLRALASLLRVASDGDREDWPNEHSDASLEFVVVAWRIENTPPAMYLYEPETQTLARLAAAPEQYTEGEELVLQAEFAKAPAIVLIIGALGAALDRYGARGHQNLLFRAGSAGQRMWLASLAHGLAGTVFAGFLPRATQRLIGVDGYHRAGLFAYAMGDAGRWGAVPRKGENCDQK